MKYFNLKMFNKLHSCHVILVKFMIIIFFFKIFNKFAPLSRNTCNVHDLFFFKIFNKFTLLSRILVMFMII